MRYLTVTKDDMNNGEGLRVVLWVAGCNHYCKGCHNQHTWDPNQGDDEFKKLTQELQEQLDKDYISGITYSGGDPLYISNVSDIAELTSWVRSKYPNKTQWLYTGHTYEKLLNQEYDKINIILKNIDVLVDGPYIEELRSPEKPWVGSSNQRVIKLKKDSVEINEII